MKKGLMFGIVSLAMIFLLVGIVSPLSPEYIGKYSMSTSGNQGNCGSGGVEWSGTYGGKTFNYCQGGVDDGECRIGNEWGKCPPGVVEQFHGCQLQIGQVLTEAQKAAHYCPGSWTDYPNLQDGLKAMSAQSKAIWIVKGDKQIAVGTVFDSSAGKTISLYGSIDYLSQLMGVTRSDSLIANNLGNNLVAVHDATHFNLVFATTSTLAQGVVSNPSGATGSAGGATFDANIEMWCWEECADGSTCGPIKCAPGIWCCPSSKISGEGERNPLD